MSAATEYLVSKSGQISVPAAVRHRWGLEGGGPVVVVDLGDAVVLLPTDAHRAVLRDALGADEYLSYVRTLDDPDLATT